MKILKISFEFLYAAIPINIYKIGHTIPNTYPGGFKDDLFKDIYHGSLPVFDDDSPPRTNVSKTKMGIRCFLFNNVLFNPEESSYSFINTT